MTMKRETQQATSRIINEINLKDARVALELLLKDWLVLTEPRWDDYVFPAQSINPPGGVSDPTRDPDDGSLYFEHGKDNRIVGNGQVPHSAVLSLYLHPHIHWLATTASAGNIVWQLEYKVYNIGEAEPADWTTVEVVSPAAEVHAISYLDKIYTSLSNHSTIIIWRLTRLGTDVRDTYLGDVKFLSFDVHYPKNSFGTIEELVHTYGTE